MFDVNAHQAVNRGDIADWRVSFGYEAVRQADGSWKDVEHITVFNNPQEIVCRPVEERDKITYSARYEAFRKGEAVPLDGTPIKDWATITKADIAACKNARIYTVEQLAETADEALQKNHIVALKYKARDWLEANKNSGVLAQLRDELDQAKSQIKALEEKDNGS